MKMFSSSAFFLFCILVSILIFSGQAFAACHAVGTTSSGDGSGSSWANRMNNLPTNLVRGDTYYLSDGQYGDYTFGTPNSGTTTITIKKAQSYDYGRSSDGCSNDISGGWNASTMGSSQAVFSHAAGTVGSNGGQGYITLDGNGRTTTAGCGVSPAVNASASDCGIKIMASGTSASTYGVLWINSTYDNGVTRATGWTVRYVELQGAGDAGNNISNSNEHTLYCRNGCNNMLVEHIYSHDSACDFIDIPYGNGVTFNLNHFKQNASSANCHGQFFLGDGNQMNNYTFSNNLIQDAQGTAYWSILNGGQASNWKIFNNVIFQLPSSVRPGISSGTFVVINSGSSATGINLIDNTWIGDHTDYAGHFYSSCDSGSCGGAFNEQGSLYYGIIDDQDGSSGQSPVGRSGFNNATESYNTIINSGSVSGYSGTGDIKATSQANPFVNWPSYNFNLTGSSTNVNSSLSLASPYNVDMAGNARPSGGVWNRGAFQYTSGSAPPPAPGAPTNLSGTAH
jgi:hypothetical protein